MKRIRNTGINRVYTLCTVVHYNICLYKIIPGDHAIIALIPLPHSSVIMVVGKTVQKFLFSSMTGHLPPLPPSFFCGLPYLYWQWCKCAPAVELQWFYWWENSSQYRLRRWRKRFYRTWRYRGRTVARSSPRTAPGRPGSFAGKEPDKVENIFYLSRVGKKFLLWH